MASKSGSKTPRRAPAGVVEKRKVVMTNVVAVNGVVATHEATDYVPVPFLEAYVADAKTRWQDVQVIDPEDHDPGPGGDHGPTTMAAHLTPSEG